MTEPKTYWEDRARETENTLRRVCDILVKHANPYMMQDMFALRDGWKDVITKLDADWKAKEKPVDEKDAARYRWLRSQHWTNETIAAVVIDGHSVFPGSDCPSGQRLDDAIDRFMKPDNVTESN